MLLVWWYLSVFLFVFGCLIVIDIVCDGIMGGIMSWRCVLFGNSVESSGCLVEIFWFVNVVIVMVNVMRCLKLSFGKLCVCYFWWVLVRICCGWLIMSFVMVLLVRNGVNECISFVIDVLLGNIGIVLVMWLVCGWSVVLNVFIVIFLVLVYRLNWNLDCGLE